MSPIAENEGLQLPAWANVARLTASTPIPAVNEVAKARARALGLNFTAIGSQRQALARLSATETTALTPYIV